MRRHPPRPRPEAPIRPLPRRTRLVRPERVPREKPAALPTLAPTQARLDRPLYCLLTAADTICAGRVWQGRCVLLFTSPAAAIGFADWTGVDAQPPIVFSRSHSEFLTQARRSFGQGFIGGLIDPTIRLGETAFLGFDVGRPGDPGARPPA
jgi:hypothetical protein